MHILTLIIKENIMKYIFIAGAPGSKWSSVSKNIRASASIAKSDYSDERTYWHDASGSLQLMHSGAYWDPGMEFGEEFDELNTLTKDKCEAEFDRPFDPTCSKIKIIKSHVFCNHLDFIKNTWPDCPIILVHRTDDSCLGWWVKCGQFDITYPLYHSYYSNLRTMANIIKNQNDGIATFSKQNSCTTMLNNAQVCNELQLLVPGQEQIYLNDDVEVQIYHNQS